MTTNVEGQSGSNALITFDAETIRLRCEKLRQHWTENERITRRIRGLELNPDWDDTKQTIWFKCSESDRTNTPPRYVI